ncbi:hypothetical protein DV737_g4441, partial [Chaetothyriales sp. CBS 132003]
MPLSIRDSHRHVNSSGHDETPEAGSLAPTYPTGGQATVEPQRVMMTRKLAVGQTRRPHTKSRKGCLPCKARKIKCGEEKESCHNCVAKDIPCEYRGGESAELEIHAVRAVRAPPRLLPQPLLSTGAETLASTDLRLFHHFLTTAYPHLPAGNDAVWLLEIPKIAEHNHYLMHALLGLGASHLYRLDHQARYNSAAVAHRGHAITGLNQAIAKDICSQADADAMLAAVYALTFQSVYMDDGLVDFMTMVRGCMLITERVESSNTSSSFCLEPNAHIRTLEPDISQLAGLDKRILHTGLDAIGRLTPILKTAADLDFFLAIQKTLQASLISTKHGFIQFAAIHDLWYSTEYFHEFTDARNLASQVMLAFFTALQLLMSPVTAPMHKPPRRSMDTRYQSLPVSITWTRKILHDMPPKIKRYAAWPEAVINQFEREFSGESRQTSLLIETPHHLQTHQAETGKAGFREPKNPGRYRASKAALSMVMLDGFAQYGWKKLKVLAMFPGFVVSNLRGTSEELRSGWGRAGEPAVSGELVRAIQSDADVGKLVAKDGQVYPW